MTTTDATTTTTTVAALAAELGYTQTPATPYMFPDALAAFDGTLESTYGHLTDDTELSEADADAIRSAWQ